MKICNWPRTERPREKLIERGANVLSDPELLALLIGSGPPAARRSSWRGV